MGATVGYDGDEADEVSVRAGECKFFDCEAIDGGEFVFLDEEHDGFGMLWEVFWLLLGRVIPFPSGFGVIIALLAITVGDADGGCS